MTHDATHQSLTDLASFRTVAERSPGHVREYERIGVEAVGDSLFSHIDLKLAPVKYAGTIVNLDVRLLHMSSHSAFASAPEPFDRVADPAEGRSMRTLRQSGRSPLRSVLSYRNFTFVLPGSG